MKLESLELTELKYFYLRGFRYISRGGNIDYVISGDIRIHETKPYYCTKGYYGQWKDESIDNEVHSTTKIFSSMLKGDYSFVEIDTPLLIEDVINNLEQANNTYQVETLTHVDERAISKTVHIGANYNEAKSIGTSKKASNVSVWLYTWELGETEYKDIEEL